MGLLQEKSFLGSLCLARPDCRHENWCYLLHGIYQSITNGIKLLVHLRGDQHFKTDAFLRSLLYVNFIVRNSLPRNNFTGNRRFLMSKQTFWSLFRNSSISGSRGSRVKLGSSSILKCFLSLSTLTRPRPLPTNVASLHSVVLEVTRRLSQSLTSTLVSEWRQIP